MADHSITIDLEENSVNSEPCISKVHVGLRNVKPEAYKPVVVSIGPYHKANPDLQAMQQNKILYLNSLLERKRRNESPKSREIYLAELKKFDREACKCYVDPVNSNIDEFAEMMLVDGCFIVEFLRKMDRDVEEKFDKDDPIFKVPWMQNQILSDMMLLENQLPYFVLSEVYSMTKSVGEKPLEEMVMSCFKFMLPRPRLYFSNTKGEKINHLLHLVHIFCRPSPNDLSAKGNFNDNSTGRAQIGTVVELQRAGVKFKKVCKIYNGELKKETEEEDDYVSLFDVDFKSGVMKVPCFKVDDTTETLLRNFIAYEQHFPNDRPKYFTDFACFMNQLINSKEDAKVLRFEEIIMNFLSGDGELSQLFSRLTDNFCESYMPYYLEVNQKVDKHYKTSYNSFMAILWRHYFIIKKPWAGVSVVTGAVMLVLTMLQTIAALRNPKDI